MNEKRDPNLEKYEEMERQIKQWRQENPKATLTEIENAIDRELAKIRQAALEEVVQEKKPEEREAYACPNCQTEMVGNGYKKRTLRTKDGQTITLNRQQLRCLQCGMTLFPPG
jgi:hypothetical protein